MLQIETRYGTLSVPDTETDLIGRFLARYGEWALDEAHFVASTLPGEHARILDGGAFVGTFGLGVALYRSVGFLCFVEANDALTAMLQDNVSRNCQVPSSVVDGLLGWQGVTLREGQGDASNMGAMSFAAVDDSSLEEQRMADTPHRIVTLAELRAQHGDFDLLKLDVEGMESGILREDAEHLARGDTSIWIECRDDPSSLASADLLLSWGLDLYYFAFPSHNPDNFRNDSAPIYPMAYEAGLLAAPKSPPTLDEELLRHHCILQPIHSLEDMKSALWRTPRWGEIDWVGASAAEVAALAGRKLRGETYETYLGPRWNPHPVVDDDIWSRLAATETALREAEALAFERLAVIETERERADGAELRMAEACAQALDRLSELGIERERATRMEDRAITAEQCAITAEQCAITAEQRAIAIETSTTWRLGAPIRRLVDSKPRLHSLIRRGHRLAANIIKHRRCR